MGTGPLEIRALGTLRACGLLELGDPKRPVTQWNLQGPKGILGAVELGDPRDLYNFKDLWGPLGAQATSGSLRNFRRVWTYGGSGTCEGPGTFESPETFGGPGTSGDLLGLGDL
jgi:hypothetical protein